MTSSLWLGTVRIFWCVGFRFHGGVTVILLHIHRSLDIRDLCRNYPWMKAPKITWSIVLYNTIQWMMKVQAPPPLLRLRHAAHELKNLNPVNKIIELLTENFFFLIPELISLRPCSPVQCKSASAPHCRLGCASPLRHRKAAVSRRPSSSSSGPRPPLSPETAVPTTKTRGSGHRRHH